MTVTFLLEEKKFPGGHVSRRSNNTVKHTIPDSTWWWLHHGEGNGFLQISESGSEDGWS